MQRTSSRLTSSQKIFFVELAGTFVVVLLATGSVVIDAKVGGALGLPFVAFAPFAGVAAMVYAFGKISMAHFNPAVTIGFFVSGHIKKTQLSVYLGAEIIGALLASLSVLAFIGSEANLGANAPNYSFPLAVIFGVEVLVTGFLMAVIFAAVYTKGLRGWSGIAIGGMVGLDIFFFSFISGASMNPARSLAPALLSGAVSDLWLYWSATFAGSAIVALLCRKKFQS
ncbi:major intrinsic protein [Candidatus Nitrososphaera gargensis Ga9.2]|uniref:Major intrinsic protein n=1 Tax=Nitrososphaera gargensis (strain Ga9.2) TaxID=1237085 RepID=K0IGI3_NITGG|nr:aquaporin [Candidatus Nitrososphaera gargensis]AFU60496.1 major intrinsic protein [Candidatus Nitrososphaera gargensis Ga9.2]